MLEPQGALWGKSLVDQWSDPLVTADGLFGHLGLTKKDDVAPVDKDCRDRAVLSDLQEHRVRSMNEAMRNQKSTRLQAVVRGWLARRRYKMHKQLLSDLLNQLKFLRETEAVTAAQKIARGCLARKELKRRQHEADKKRLEAEGKKRKKGRKPIPKAAKPTEEMTRMERLLMVEEQFLEGWDHFVAGVDSTMRKVEDMKHLDDCLKIWEKAAKSSPHDKVLLHMIDRVHRCRDMEKLRHQQLEPDRLAKAAKGKGAKARTTPPGSAQKKNSLTQTSSRKSSKPDTRSNLEKSYQRHQSSSGLPPLN